MDPAIKITRETEFYQGYIRLRMSVTNDSPYSVMDVTLDLIYDGDILRIERHKPPSINVKQGKYILGNIDSGDYKSIVVDFDPLICSKGTDIDCDVTYKDYKGKRTTHQMEPKKISVICPILNTESDINIGILKELVEKLPSRDSRIYEVQNSFDTEKLVNISKEILQKHSVKHVRTMHDLDGKKWEIWYYGKTKVDKYELVIKISITTAANSLELFAATQTAESLTGLLAEIGRELRDSIESKVSGKGRVVNVSISKSKIDRSNLLDLCNMDGTCNVNIVIDKSDIDRSSIGSSEGKECPVCGNIIDPSNKSLLCKCGAKFCQTCESWFRKETSKSGEKPLCETCFTAEQEKLARESEEKARLKAAEEAEKKKKAEERLRRQKEEEERIRLEQEELERRREEEERKAREAARRKAVEEAEKKEEERQRKEREEAERKRQEEQEQRRREEERKAREAARRKAAEEAERKRKQKKKMMFIPVMIIIVLVGYWMFSPLLGANSTDQNIVVPQNTKVVDSSVAATEINNVSIDDKTASTNTQLNLEPYTNSIGMEFVLIPAGEFEMGADDGASDKTPVHEVTIGQAYYLGKYEVTQEQWVAVMGSNPSYFKGDNNPVEDVSWNDVQEFVKKLNSKEGTDKYRLPSEAEWEYACRAGTTTEYSFGDSESKLGDYAWYGDNSDSKTHPVGQKKPNPWGLYDMHGNVWEWCQDGWHDSYKGAPADGSAWEDSSSSRRVLRGAGWFGFAGYYRSAFRNDVGPDYRDSGIGFRLLWEV